MIKTTRTRKLSREENRKKSEKINLDNHNQRFSWALQRLLVSIIHICVNILEFCCLTKSQILILFSYLCLKWHGPLSH